MTLGFNRQCTASNHRIKHRSGADTERRFRPSATAPSRPRCLKAARRAPSPRCRRGSPRAAWARRPRPYADRGQYAQRAVPVPPQAGANDLNHCRLRSIRHLADGLLNRHRVSLSHHAGCVKAGVPVRRPDRLRHTVTARIANEVALTAANEPWGCAWYQGVKTVEPWCRIAYDRP